MSLWLNVPELQLGLGYPPHELMKGLYPQETWHHSNTVCIVVLTSSLVPWAFLEDHGKNYHKREIWFIMSWEGKRVTSPHEYVTS